MKREDLIKRAKDLILNGKIQGSSSLIYKQVADTDPEMLEQLLDEIADQAEDEHSTKAANRIYGSELVGIALTLRTMDRNQKKKEKEEIKESLRQLISLK